jgi:histidinol dehydrogenase
VKTVRSSDLADDFFRPGPIEEIAGVEKVIAGVQGGGDEALRKFAREFDRVELGRIRIDDREIEEAPAKVGSDVMAVIEAAAEAVMRFTLKQLEGLRDFDHEIRPGVRCGQRIFPLRRVGIYVPGGRHPLASTVLMCAVPARAAGVKEIALCSPPSHGGTVHPAILAAARTAGVDEVYRVGGPAAIAAMAFGTETIRPVDKIVGPGSRRVAAAKKLVYGAAGIDFIAGPTEVMIIADDSADPSFVAADLLAQAEHDEHASAILVTDSPALAKNVAKEIERQLEDLDTAPTAKASLDGNGLAILVNDLAEAIDIADRKAPEHLELIVRDPGPLAGKFRNYGTLFIGPCSPEPLGDYSSGINHTLPTGGAARYTGGLHVKDFLKFQTTLEVTPDGLAAIGPDAELFGRIEGLSAHANAVALRLKKLGSPRGFSPGAGP